MSVSESDDVPDDSARITRLEERLNDLEEQVGGNHVGAVLENLVDGKLEAQRERDALKEVLDAVCEEVGIDPEEILYDAGEEIDADVEEYL
jgi:hypothetical protein